jgi:hypothetical protein
MLAGMEADFADRLERFAAGQYQPTTFIERGVSVPFTTPVLAGARTRPGERAGLDLVVANPAGTRGHYVLPWSALPEICTPTLHDRLMWQRISGLASPSPPGIRGAARAVAREGAAGRAAAAAATAAESAEQNAVLVTNFQLLLRLVREMEGPAAMPPVERDAPQRQEARAKRALAKLATRLAVPGDGLAARLEALAAVYAGIGIAPGATARVPRQIERLSRLSEAMARHAALALDPTEVACAQLVEEGARITVDAASAAMAAALAPLAELAALMGRPAAEDAKLGELAARPDWLLDGWMAIIELWSAAAPGAPARTLFEMAQVVPVMPREVHAWTGQDFAWEAGSRVRRLVRAREDWRTGNLHESVARNEVVRAMAA